MERKSPRIAVLGAGVVGMTVASMLQDRLASADVTVIAEKFHEATVSFVAAGIFRPGTSFRGPTKEVTKLWVNDSWNYWQHILESPSAEEAGVMKVPCYVFSKQNYHVTRNHLIEDLVPDYRAVNDEELELCGGGFKYGSYFTTLKVGCDRYLPWVETKFKTNGGKIVKSRIDSFSDLRGKYDLVFNCTGMGAKYLCKDEDLVPIRGQVIKVRAPWLKNAYYGDYDTYIIPGIDGVATLGGVRQYDSYNTEVCKYDSAAILDRCCQLFPELRQAEVVATRVGLRPHRVPVRVEPELVGVLKVVHCYGHGGYGVTCAPGTAAHAVRIGIDYLNTNVQHKL